MRQRAGSSSMGGFSFAQFRTLLSVVRRGEERDELNDSDLLGTSGSKMSPVAKRVLSGVLLLLLCFVLFQGGALVALSDLGVVQMFFMMIAMLVVLVVIMGFYQAVNMLYFVKDLGFYLALPIPAITIMAAKITHYILSQVLINCVVVAFGLGFLAGRGAAPIDFVLLVLAFLPCVIATALALIIVVIPVMRFSPVAADKDKFARVFGTLTTIVSLLVAMVINFGMNSSSSSSSMMLTVSDISANGAVSILMTIVCAPTLFASEVFGGNAFLGLVGMYVLALLYIVVTGLFAKKWYFEGVRGMQGGAGKKSRKRYSEGELAGAVKQRGQFKAFFSQDLATMIRVPAFFQQFVVTMVLEPLAIAVVGVFGIGIKDAGTIDQLRDALLVSSVDSNAYLSILGMVVFIGVFASIPSYLFSLALARDGEDFFFLRAMPLNMRDYALSKFASGYLVGRVPLFVVLLVALIVLGASVDVTVILVLTFALPLTAVDLLMFAIGSKKPQMTWENEAQFFKQSDVQLRMVIAVVLGVVLFLVPGVIAFVFSLAGASGYAGAAAMLIVCLVECAGAAALAFKVAPRNMERVRP